MKMNRFRIRGAALWLCLAAPCSMAAEPAATAAPADAAAAQARVQTEQQLADAQRRLEEAARQVAELSSQLGNETSRRMIMIREHGPRALLGVQVANASGQPGPTVSAVSPGGAAEAAGIKVGDVITSIGGADLPAGTDSARAVVDRMRELQPGLSVKVGVLRDGRKMEFDVTPRAAPAMAFGGPGAGGAAGGPQIRRFEFRGPPGMGPDRAALDDGTRFAGMEFATLSERLGGYFGVKSGVLVVRAGAADNAWKLQDGDVILSIDGRTPTSAAHAGRILRSYQPGEKVKLRVQRDRRAQDFEVAATGGVMDFRLERKPPAPGGAG